MMMPFGSVFSTNNLKIAKENLPLLFGITGVFSIIFGPIIGKLSDKIGKYKMFVIGSMISFTMVGIYTHLGPTPFGIVIVLNVILFVGISSRMISSSALLTAVPKPQDRGAFMSINASIQQISGGIAAAIAGMIVVQQDNGELLHYPTLGFVVMGSMLITIGLMYILNQQIKKNLHATTNNI
jgi:MFS family permease